MGMIQEFQQANEERRRELKQLQDEVTNYMHTEVGKIRSEVATMLKDFAGEGNGRQSAVNGIRSQVAGMHSEVATILKELAKADDERASEVANYTHAEVGKIRSEVAHMFKDFVREGNGRRSTVASRHEMVWGKAPARKIMATPKVAPATGTASPRETLVAEPTAADELRERVFAYLTNHPDGTRLTELEESFGIARIQTARVIRELMDSNKVAKRELLYFVI